MKVIRKLTITNNEFFDYLETQLLKIANDNLDGQEAYTNLDLKDGFSIIQNRDVEINRIELKINQYRRGSLYYATASSLTDSYELRYDVEDTADGILVTYEQQDCSKITQQKKGFFSKLGEALYLSRMSNSLYDMQREILKLRTT